MAMKVIKNRKGRVIGKRGLYVVVRDMVSKTCAQFTVHTKRTPEELRDELAEYCEGAEDGDN